MPPHCTHLPPLVNVSTFDLGDSQDLLGFPVASFNVQRQGETIDGLLKVGLSQVRMSLCCCYERGGRGLAVSVNSIRTSTRCEHTYEVGRGRLFCCSRCGRPGASPGLVLG